MVNDGRVFEMFNVHEIFPFPVCFLPLQESLKLKDTNKRIDYRYYFWIIFLYEYVHAFTEAISTDSVGVASNISIFLAYIR